MKVTKREILTMPEREKMAEEHLSRKIGHVPGVMGIGRAFSTYPVWTEVAVPLIDDVNSLEIALGRRRSGPASVRLPAFSKTVSGR